MRQTVAVGVIKSTTKKDATGTTTKACLLYTSDAADE